jgi:predicted SAM-dependent methyltransferase
MYVQYGCGFCAPKDWTNFDASPTLRWERLPVIGKLYTKNSQRFPAGVLYGDIVKGLPVAPESCKGVYASHILEHLTLEDFNKALKNTRAILQVNGIFRMVVPDLEWAARQYIEKLDAQDSEGNSFFLDATNLGSRKRSNGVRGLLYGAFQTSAHRWMWDSTALTRALQGHGFHNVRRCSFGDCEDQMFKSVEDEGRFEHAVAMEARR